jgi:ring-1,2-phenylacetyl-CoA epoxidase subunit PaaD
MKPSVEEVYQWLEQVKDPEIPVLSIVDLGIINEINITDDFIQVEMTPTFVGCPALDIMKMEVINAIKQKGVQNVSVNVSFRNPWSSDKISAKGKAALKQFGLAPPPSSSFISDIHLLENVPCPRCDSTNTEMRSPFGSTLCRSIHYCLDCKDSFEQFKPI